MTKSEYEKACYSIGIKQNNISDDLIKLLSLSQFYSLFSKPKGNLNEQKLREELRKRVKMVKV